MWTKDEIERTIATLIDYLSRQGVSCKKGKRLSAPRQSPVEWEIKETGPDGVYLASIYFLPGGMLGAKISGFYVEDTSLTKIAAAIAGRFPGKEGDWTAYEFKKLESRAARHP